jgi:hypothetical protein
MQSQSRQPHLSPSLNRNKKLDTTASLARSSPSDPSLSADTSVHVHRAPLAQIDQQLFVSTAITAININSTVSADLTSPALTPLARASSESTPPSRVVGKPTMPRRSSYTSEESLYAPGGGSQGPAYRRLSQYVFFQFFASFCHIFSTPFSFSLPPLPISLPI